MKAQLQYRFQKLNIIDEPEPVSIPLKCCCPPTCSCGHQNEPKQWHHKQCGTESKINCEGDIFCANHKTDNQCKPYFIKNAHFKCAKSKNWEKYRDCYVFIMALAQSMQAASFSLKENDLLKFNQRLNMAVIEKWNN